MRLAFNGRATRNSLLLLCMMEFVLFIGDCRRIGGQAVPLGGSPPREWPES